MRDFKKIKGIRVERFNTKGTFREERVYFKLSSSSENISNKFVLNKSESRYLT